jgi:hypothetical protein
VGALHLGSFLKEFEHNGGAAEGEKKADENRGAATKAGLRRDQKDRSDGEKNLKGAADKHKLLDPQEVVQGEFDSYGKEEKDDADFRQDLDVLRIRDDPQGMGAYDHAGDEETDHGGYPEPMANEKDRDGKPKNEQKIYE